MFFTICLYISAGICLLGILFRVSSWFVSKSVPGSENIPTTSRVFGVFKSFFKTLASPRILLLPKVLVFDVLLQGRILKTSPVRWIAHMLIFSGFILLTALHAMDEIVTEKLFDEYFSTLNPFFFLRNVFGTMVLAGVLLATVRRVRRSGPFLQSRFGDKYAILIVAVILLSGFFLDSIKIISEPVFNRMVEDYFSEEEDGDLAALKTSWAEDYNVVFSNSSESPNPKLLEKGRELNESYCESCHSKPETAFLSFSVSRALKPAAGALAKSRADIWMYWIHVMACFLGLAYLPFSKFFHLISDPIVLTVNGILDKRNTEESASAVTRRAVELDACINCGACSRVCSVSPLYTLLENPMILPAEKIRNMKRMAKPSVSDNAFMYMSAEGASICTQCFKCTEVCPVSINLQDQWIAGRAMLEKRGFSAPGVWIKENSADHWARVFKDHPLRNRDTSPVREKIRKQLDVSDRFAACIQCQTCTNVCPVVAAVTGEQDAVDITPQKVMNLLRMGLKDLAMGSRMVWDCATCYQCQENCPQGIHVTEILYELRNMAYERLRDFEDREIDERASKDEPI